MAGFSYNTNTGNRPTPTLQQQFDAAITNNIQPKDFAVATAINDTLVSFSEAVFGSNGDFIRFQTRSVKCNQPEFQEILGRVGVTKKALGILDKTPSL